MSEDEFMPMIPKCLVCGALQPKEDWYVIMGRMWCSDQCITKQYNDDAQESKEAEARMDARATQRDDD